ncbi:3-deoxy-manno-octulosonate cytidylyltransferase [Acidocella aminolytica]|jgi:3-deoxy-manno-octulosonate cytidylyltransferase (CMP-KDO synthetase)|uniref:3-deoxy-D-manno-octulosonate cytidylyltransferase n=1 Tax=Acidocella aminolytica 101 = DSM 11237 TaxID=1120923 RepID=A0A0D6PFF1_9PROT|nr:3-deoxy-manno-octulosonate cytidylyltransferase [Acidocella aminolytica]GAN79933.1 3-deoxy-D-manno-octulosonate cytidylyltransferase [Acidocella aminolytica 101 = DSM 11237]GBQ36857.1 3-deoxy-D-manno-octulosonate cytidylyltransferase [Acidocella aminolytica 101 = DSM 11237]SHE59044.1 3-deoxy-manno-octulosonate cytidylyltransferase (CMP-KDO synthetase) [Acidocella aminolytica 101 = DSM 11237]
MVLNPLILIPARLGSTRLPAKVLADIGGKPMIAHVLARAQEAGLGPVAVACGEVQVAEAVEKAGGIAVLTDPDLPSGSDRIFAALQSLDAEGKHDVIVNLQGDLPSIDPSYLATVLKPLAQGYDIGTLVAPITTETERNALSVVKCACAFADGAEIAPALYFSRHLIPSGDGAHWHHIGIYAYRRAALATFVSLPPSPLEQREKLEQLRALEAGLRIGAAQVIEAPFGVDTPEDLDRAREALSK